MRRLLLFSVLGTLAVASTASPQRTSVLTAAADALNVADIKSLEYTGVGAHFFVGQAYRSGEPWPILPVKNYTVSIDYEIGAFRVDRTEEMGPVMPLGGGQAFRGSRRVVQEPLRIGTELPRGPERMIHISLTPHGFVKAAIANRATARSTPQGTEVSFTVDGKYRVIGNLNQQHLLERVRTWIDSPVVGDLPIEVIYSGYRDFGGVQFPSHIAQMTGGHPSLDLWIVSVTANPRLDLSVPEDVSEALPVAMDAQRLAEGVYLLSGRGTSNSLVIEMRDHLVVCEANSEAQSLGVIAKLKEMFPSKPIRYIVNTHHHWDHSAGLRMYVAAGATIVTHEQNRAWFEQALSAPRTLNPLRRPQAASRSRFLTVGDRGELTDGQRVLELHVITGNRQAAGMLMVSLPNERLLFEADVWTPPPGDQRLDPAWLPLARALHDSIRRLNLQVDRILPNHNRSSDVQRGRTYPMAELTTFVSGSARN